MQCMDQQANTSAASGRGLPSQDQPCKVLDSRVQNLLEDHSRARLHAGELSSDPNSDVLVASSREWKRGRERDMIRPPSVETQGEVKKSTIQNQQLGSETNAFSFSLTRRRLRYAFASPR